MTDNTAPVFGEDEGGNDPPEAIVLAEATLVTVTGAQGSTVGGTRGALKFEVHPELTDGLFAYIGQQAFNVTFGRTGLGDGLTIGTYTIRGDAEGAARAFINLVVPQNQVTRMMKAAAGLVGHNGRLVLGPSQVTLDEVLTARAE